MGSPPHPLLLAGRLQVPLAACPRRSVFPVADRPSTLGGSRLTRWTHRLLPVVLARPAWEWWGCVSARCGASWTGARDWLQMMSVGLAGRWGLHGL